MEGGGVDIKRERKEGERKAKRLRGGGGGVDIKRERKEGERKAKRLRGGGGGG